MADPAWNRDRRIRATGVRSALVVLALVSACDAASTGPVYPVCTDATQECVDRLEVAPDLSLPFYRNFSLTTSNPAITEAIIVIHGVDRDANNYFHSIATITKQADRQTSTLVIAPHFACTEDSPPSGTTYWDCDDGWAHGRSDLSGGTPPVSSFAVIDKMLGLLADKSVFPQLTNVVVTGFSAGGQFTQRYAAMNRVDPVAGLSIHYMPLSPSSFGYLDASRLTEDAACSSDGSCTGAFEPYWDASDCSDYDRYPYGLDERNGYVGLLTPAQIQAQFIGRDVTYGVGDEDTFANAKGTDMDVSCEANAQGFDRLERTLAFFNRMHENYHATHPLVIVTGCMHSETCVYFSPQLRALLFR